MALLLQQGTLLGDENDPYADLDRLRDTEGGSSDSDLNMSLLDDSSDNADSCDADNDQLMAFKKEYRKQLRQQYMIEKDAPFEM